MSGIIVLKTHDIQLPLEIEPEPEQLPARLERSDEQRVQPHVVVDQRFCLSSDVCRGATCAVTPAVITPSGRQVSTRSRPRSPGLLWAMPGYIPLLVGPKGEYVRKTAHIGSACGQIKAICAVFRTYRGCERANRINMYGFSHISRLWTAQLKQYVRFFAYIGTVDRPNVAVCAVFRTYRNGGRSAAKKAAFPRL